MKTLLAIALSLGIVGLISAPCRAQTPSIAGIGMSNGTSPLRMFYYWSIYGSNLSSGAGSYVAFEVGGLKIDPPYEVSSQTNYFSSSLNNPGYWYESSSQINFFAQAYNFPPYYINGVGYIRVCSAAGLCSSSVYVPVQT